MIVALAGGVGGAKLADGLYRTVAPDELTIIVNTGDWQCTQEYCPGPIVQRTCRMPGTWHFDPCTCKCTYCPGPCVSYSVQCPGKYVTKRVWVPRQECKKVCCTRYVLQEQCHSVPYTCPCRAPPRNSSVSRSRVTSPWWIS